MVAPERIFHQKHDVWDVHTDKHRWWVITTPTNLYLQRDFPSLDYILSFHVGLTARTFARQEKKSPADAEERDRLSAAWRRWEQAADDLDAAEEAEHFQAIGMRCRECLLEFVRSASKPEFVTAGQSAPARGDFIHWSEIIAYGVARGGRAQDLRTLLKVTAKATWQFVSWLTHATGAVRFDAEIALDATRYVTGLFGQALVRHERGRPDRCPKCASYLLTSDYRPVLDEASPYRTFCASCEWTDKPDRSVESSA